MGRKANPETTIKIAQAEKLLAEDNKLSWPRACEMVGLNLSAFRSAMAKRKEREEEALSWQYVGKSKASVAE